MAKPITLVKPHIGRLLTSARGASGELSSIDPGQAVASRAGAGHGRLVLPSIHGAAYWDMLSELSSDAEHNRREAGPQ
jgi:hypothetical protein